MFMYTAIFHAFFYKFIIFFIAATHGVYDRPIITPRSRFFGQTGHTRRRGGVAAWNTFHSANWTIRWFIKILSTRRDLKAVHNRFSPTLEQRHRREIDESPSFKFYAELMLNPERDGTSRRSKEAWPRRSPNCTISVRRRRLFSFATIAVERKRLSVLKILFPPQLGRCSRELSLFSGKWELDFYFLLSEKTKIQ